MGNLGDSGDPCSHGIAASLISLTIPPHLNHLKSYLVGYSMLDLGLLRMLGKSPDEYFDFVKIDQKRRIELAKQAKAQAAIKANMLRMRASMHVLKLVKRLQIGHLRREEEVDQALNMTPLGYLRAMRVVRAIEKLS